MFCVVSSSLLLLRCSFFTVPSARFLMCCSLCAVNLRHPFSFLAACRLSPMSQSSAHAPVTSALCLCRCSEPRSAPASYVNSEGSRFQAARTHPRSAPASYVNSEGLRFQAARTHSRSAPASYVNSAIEMFLLVQLLTNQPQRFDSDNVSRATLVCLNPLRPACFFACLNAAVMFHVKHTAKRCPILRLLIYCSFGGKMFRVKHRENFEGCYEPGRAPAGAKFWTIIKISLRNDLMFHVKHGRMAPKSCAPTCG